MDIKKDIRFRVYLTFSLMLLFAVAIIARVGYIQLVKGEELRAASKKAHTKTEILTADRGNILTEQGKVLSATKPQFDIRIDFQSIQPDTFERYIDTLSTCIAQLFGNKSQLLVKREMSAAFKRGDRYWLLRSKVHYLEYQQLRQFPIFNKGARRGGFIAESKFKRENPYGILGFRTIGLWRENVTNIGLEQTYDSALRGKPGSRVVRKMTGNTWVPIRGSEIEPANGRDIVTTIDIDIQEVAEQSLLKVLTENKCQWGTVIVMETATGKIRALANLGLQSDGSYWEDYNYAMIASEPGSTFKLFSLYSLLEDGYVTLDSKVNVGGGVAYFGRQRVRDDHAGMGTVDVRTAFAKSSNVAFAKLVDDHYKNDPKKYLRHLQYVDVDKKTGVDLVGESRPLLKTPESKSWSNTVTLPWIAYGYESLITPLRTCAFYNAVANNGKMMKPYLVSEIRDYSHTIKKFGPTVLVESIGKPSTVKQLQAALRQVVVSGTGKRVQSPYYNSAGKTGTAQVAGKGFSYSDGIRQGSFVGYFPYEHPRYTIAVMVRSTPHGAYYGATVGAPIFKMIADKLYTTHIGGWQLPMDNAKSQALWSVKRGTEASYYYGLRPLGIAVDQNNDMALAALSLNAAGKVQVSAQSVSGHTVPDVQNMGLKDALFVLENTGLRVATRGTGKVAAQSLLAGTTFRKGQTISLELN